MDRQCTSKTCKCSHWSAIPRVSARCGRWESRFRRAFVRSHMSAHLRWKVRGMRRQCCAVLGKLRLLLGIGWLMGWLTGLSRSRTAHHGELGCFTEVHSETVLALPTEFATVKDAMLAMHGILVAWASSDLSVLPAMPGSSPTNRPIEMSSDGQREPSTTLSAHASPTSNAISPHTLTVTPLMTVTESMTEKAEPQISDSAGEPASVTQDTLTPEGSLSAPPTSITSASAPTSVSATPHPTHHLPPSAIAGISIGAAAVVATLAGLAASAILFRRRRRRAKTHVSGVDVRIFDSASEYHEDKRRWSELSSSFGTASRGGSEQAEAEVSEADSRAVVPTVSELEGD